MTTAIAGNNGFFLLIPVKVTNLSSGCFNLNSG
jgi:hypothetical protein